MADAIHISEILPATMRRIEHRMERTRRRAVTLGKGCLQRYRRRRGLRIKKPQWSSEGNSLSEWPAARRETPKLAFVEQK